MDYNAEQTSLSPCQIGIIHNNLNTCLASRFVYKCSNCMPTVASFDLPAMTCGGLTNIWLDGRATWNNHSYKLEIDRVDGYGVPIAGTHYDNTVGLRLERVQLDAYYTFTPYSTYRVKITSYNNCGSVSVRVRTFSTNPCSVGVGISARTSTISPTPLPVRK